MRFATHVRNTARLLLVTIQGESMDPENRLRKIIGPAIKSVLRSHINGTEIDARALKVIALALSEPLRGLSAKTERAGKRMVIFLRPNYPDGGISPRMGAQLLIEYLDYFRQNLDLPIPFGICKREGCNEIFIKKKSHAQYCSTKCKEAAWRKAKIQENGNYYRNHRREERKVEREVRRKQREARQRKKKSRTPDRKSSNRV